MPDITMCMNDNCPVRKDCYRHTATPSEWQSWSVFEWDGKDGCGDFSPNEKSIAKTAAAKAVGKKKPKKEKSGTPEIDEIMDSFDFERVHATMLALNWKWAFLSSTPTLKEIMTNAKEQLTKAYNSPLKKYTSGYGGFVVKKRKWGLSLAFEVANWDTYKE